MTNQEIARTAQLIFNIVKAFMQFTNDENTPASWDRQPDESKQNLIDFVNEVINNPDKTPEDFHNIWLNDMSTLGWKYGETRDLPNKLHPFMVTFDKLPEQEKVKYFLSWAIVKGYLA